MTIYIRDPATDKAVRRLAKLKRQSLTHAIREAVEREYEAVRKKPEKKISEKLHELAERFSKVPRTGLKADKAFFDELSGDI
jgi:antitoxin VapB